MLGESTRITLVVTQTLESLNIPYAVGGSLASSLHGVMRSTLDVDIVANMRIEHTGRWWKRYQKNSMPTMR